MKRYVPLPGLLLLTLVSGCFYELRDEFTECKISCANKMAARASWRATRGACSGMTCPHSFKEGFMSGYIAVANGGTGCLPAVPQIDCHNHMWLDRCCESDKMEAWYDGYEHGALAAKSEGMADANRVTTRIPHATPVDYSHSSQMNSSDDPSMGPSIPPAPLTGPEVLDGPQTRRQLQEVLQ